MAQNTGTSAPTGSVPRFTPILPPKIESTSLEALVKWKRERREYEAKLRARCRVTGEDFRAVTEAVVEAFDPDLLDTFGELQLGFAAVDITEGLLMAEIEHIVASLKNDTLPDIKYLFKHELELDIAESDVKARYDTSTTSRCLTRSLWTTDWWSALV